MAPSIEANSLSGITQLAANPPTYPRNPTEEKRPSLTLYIARVPGSQDIILTTLKPQLKNVTAEDIASCLYYLHLSSERDAKLLEQEKDVVTGQAETSFYATKQVTRKALPESVRSSLDLSCQAKGSSSIVREQKRKPVTARQNTNASTAASDSSYTAVQDKQAILRRPLGPRPLSQAATDRKPLSGAENKPLGSVPPLQHTPHPSSPSRISQEALKDSNLAHMVSDDCEAEREYSSGFQIVLIRRDPSSGAQWNIGSVAGHLAPAEGHDRRRKASASSKTAAFDISIHLTTPGYARFRNSGLAGNSMTHLGNSLPSHNATVDDSAKSQALPSSSHGFQRLVRMEGHGFWTRSSSSLQRTRGLSNVSDKQSTTHGGVNEALPAKALVDIDFDGSQSKGYVFSSPWGGRCKFSTGGGGRSLRCKHTLPRPISTSSTTDSLSAPQAPAAVSELRFNLPSAAVFASSMVSAPTKSRGSDGPFPKPKFGHIRNKLSTHMAQSPPPLPARPPPTSYSAMYPSDDEQRPPLPPRSYQSSVEAESSNDELPHGQRGSQKSESGTERPIDGGTTLDLSLGQERAGGGNRGKRAKLGKLIVHDEGLKMLDLVVAVNMGIWWSVWESEFV